MHRDVWSVRTLQTYPSMRFLPIGTQRRHRFALVAALRRGKGGSEMQPKRVPCPVCASSVAVEVPSFPFCSPRCRTLDLSNWLDERYRLDDPATSDGLPESLH